MQRTISAALGLALVAGLASAQVQHGSVQVIENDGGNTNTSVTLNRVGGFGPWLTVGDAGTTSRADYFVDMLTGDDVNLGVLITSVNQLERTEPSVLDATTQLPYTYFATPAIERGNGNRYFIVVTESPSGVEVNFDVAFAYFPIADGWLTAHVRNSANNAGMDNYVGTPGFQIGNESDFNGVGNWIVDFTLGSLANGHYGLFVPGTHFGRDGVILITGGKNEDNRADVFINYDGTAVLHCIDNGSESGGENDSVAFVFVPENTPGVVMGQVTGTARHLFKQGDATVEMVGQPTQNGTFRVTIPGQDPTTGTLIANPHSELSGTSVDNCLFVQPDGDGWLITTRDIEPLPGGLQLQDIGSQIAFHYAFFPNTTLSGPGVPSKAWESRLNDVVAGRVAVTEITPDNGAGDMRADFTAGSSDALGIFSDNKGDVGISWLNQRLAGYIDNSQDSLEGILMASATEFLRDNFTTGGVSGWTTVSVDNSEIRTHAASLAGGEINSNFATAFIPVGAGFQQEAEVVADAGLDTVAVSGDPATDGVLIAINWNNTNVVTTATPGVSGYDISFWNGSGGAQETTGTEYGYVYFPYSTPGIIAGQVDATGAVLSGSGNFSTATGVDTLGFPVTTITIPGVDARTDGMLLLVSTQNAVSMAWEAGDSGEFEVAGLDLTTEFPGQAGFQFVYIPYEGFGTGGGCPADLSGSSDPNDPAYGVPDGAADASDFFYYLDQFVAANLAVADLTGAADPNDPSYGVPDGNIDASDFFYYLDLFVAGCP